MEAKNPVNSILTAFRILEELSRSGGRGVSEITRNVDATKGTVHNHLATLRQEGYVVQQNEKYYLGSRLIGFGTSVQDQSLLYEHSGETLDSLAQSTGEVAFIAVEEEEYAVYQRLVPDQAGNAPIVHEGDRLPLHCSAPGKCLLVDRSNTEIRDYLDSYSGMDLSDRTISHPDELVEEIRTVREQNLGFARGEYDIDLYEVATPIKAGDHRSRGTVGVFGPKERLGGKALQQDTAGLVLNAAKRIEVKIHQSSV